MNTGRESMEEEILNADYFNPGVVNTRLLFTKDLYEQEKCDHEKYFIETNYEDRQVDVDERDSASESAGENFRPDGPSCRSLDATNMKIIDEGPSTSYNSKDSCQVFYTRYTNDAHIYSECQNMNEGSRYDEMSDQSFDGTGTEEIDKERKQWIADNVAGIHDDNAINGSSTWINHILSSLNKVTLR